MPNSCLDNIVTLGICDDEQPSSGFTLLQAAGISIKNLNDIADDSTGTATVLANLKKRLAINLVKNDFTSALMANNIIPQVANRIYNSSTFKANNYLDTSTLKRGVTLFKSKGIRGNLTSQTINSLDIYGNATGGITVTIYDGTTTSEYDFDIVNGQINTFPINYKIKGNDFCRIVIDNTNFQPASAYIDCKEGCGGTMPNECGYCVGWDGARQVKYESYGINVNFSCNCDYEQLLCNLSTTYIGELIWLKWQALIFDEQYKSNRFDNWVVYNNDKLPDMISNLDAQYAQQWNNLMKGLYNILRTYRDSCLNCQDLRILPNG